MEVPSAPLIATFTLTDRSEALVDGPRKVAAAGPVSRGEKTGELERRTPAAKRYRRATDTPRRSGAEPIRRTFL